jgi:hypothetical protein
MADDFDDFMDDDLDYFWVEDAYAIAVCFGVCINSYIDILTCA